MLQAAQALALGDQHGLPVGRLKEGGQTVPRVVLLPEAGARAAGDAALAQGRVFSIAHHRLGLLHAVELGDDQTHGARVQHFQDGRAGDLLHTGKGRRPVELGAADQIQRRLGVARAVFRIHDDVIKARQRQAFRRRGRGDLQKAADRPLAAQQLFPCRVFHGLSLRFAFSLPYHRSPGIASGAENRYNKRKPSERDAFLWTKNASNGSTPRAFSACWP